MGLWHLGQPYSQPEVPVHRAEEQHSSLDIVVTVGGLAGGAGVGGMEEWPLAISKAPSASSAGLAYDPQWHPVSD